MAASPLDNLEVLRRALLERRRQIAAEASQAHADWADIEDAPLRASKGSEHGRPLQAVQEAIEAVDRAIADEKRLVQEEEPEERESFFDRRTRGRTDIA